MSNAELAQYGSVVFGLIIAIGLVGLLQETRVRNRYLRVHKRRREMKRLRKFRNIHEGRLSNDLTSC